MKQLEIILSIIFLSWVCSLSAQSRFEITETGNEIILEWHCPNLSFQSIVLQNEIYSLPVLSGLAHQQTPGAPQLPVDATLIYAPDLKLESLDSVTALHSTGTVCPAPAYSQTDAGDVLTRYEPDPAIYSSSALYPQSFVRLDKATSSGKTVWRVQITPLQYDPVNNRLVQARYLRLRLAKSTQPSAREPEALFKSSTTKTVSRRFEQAAQTKPVKLKCAQPGVYAINGSDLQAIDVAIQSLNPSTLQLYHKDQEQSIQLQGMQDDRFDPDDRILFYAERLSGDTTFYHAYTDTNIYWLTWGITTGRHKTASVTSAPTSAPLSSFNHTLHIERDLDYYQGDDNHAIQNSFTTPGEGWVWEKFIDPGTRFETAFDCPGYIDIQDSVSFRLRVRGQTRSSSANDHHIQVDINGFTGVDAFFDDREERIYRFKVPGDLIYSRDNALIIRSVRQSSDPISRFYFDWLECDSPVRFQAHDDRLCFSDSTLPAHASIRVSGFSGDSVFVWNQTSGDIIAPTISQSVIRRIRVVSAGLADGNRAEFLIDGETMYSGSRGISLVFLDSHSGEFLYSKTYDTYGSETASQELSNNIAEVPDGTIVLAAVRDDGASRLSEQAIASLQNCGSQYIDELKYRDSWAFIGRKNDTTTVYEQHTLKGAGQAAVSTFLEFQGTAQDFTATFQAENLNNSAFIVFEENSIRKPKLINRSEIRNPLHHPARYLIITDPMFEEAAQQLADYRKDQEHISSAEIIFVQDIYDTFNDGIKHPRAIKTFLRDAWQIWGVEKPRYVLLLGDASWDPKLNMPDSRFRDIIPSLGNPVSDVLYSCFDDLLPELAIGRLPAATAEQAAMLVSKIIEYENTPPAEWNKHLLFISGGFDAVEQSRFNSQSQALSDEFVSPAPFGGDAYHIKKSDATLIEGEHTANIIDHFAKGMAWVNFIGHAGSRTWELFFHNSDIDRLNNAPYYPFISSMTCHTGRFAEPGDESFGEHFINARQKGCVAFWGTSGWGYTYEDNQLLRQLYPAILQDTVRILGDALNQAKVGLWEQQGVTSHVTNVILQYNLLGDPAMRLQLPNQPDLTFSDDPINIEPRIPSEADSTAQITCALSNIGLFPPDSLQFRLRATSQENPETRITWNLKREPFTLTDTIKVTWPLAGMSGTVNLDASIDAQDAIPESNEQNNSATLTTQVYSSSVRLVQPAEFARISNGAVTCIVENPPNIPYKELSYEFQLDTSRTFSSPVLKTRTRQADPLQTLCPFNDVQPGIYFWRVRILDQTPPLWQTGSFTAVSDSLNGWQQASAQFIENSYQSTQSGSNGVRLSTENISLRVESAGKRQGNFARILVNSQSVMPTSRGFNVAVLTNNCAEICATATFDTWGNEQASEKLADFISNVPENDYVLVAVKDEASNRLYEPALNALETLGSVHCRDIGPFDSWAIIGRKGAPPGNVPEAYSPSDQETIAAVSDSIRRHAAFGQILSPKIGPAAAWSKAEIQSTLPDSTNINVHLIGHPISGAPDTLYTGSPANSLDLSFIDAQHTPYLSLGAQLSSQNYRITPVLQDWHVLFDPTPDIALSPQLFSQNRDTVTSGEPVTFYFDVYNLGASMTDSGSIRILSKNRGEDLHTLYYPPLAHSKSHALTFETPISASGITHFYITADPENELVESSESNNVLHTTVFAKKDTIPPTLLITVDDRPVYDGDLISPRPNIVISIQDNNQKSIRDTSQINLSLNGARISFTDQDVLTYNKETQNIYFSPQLDDGHHKLIVNVFDSENNSTAESFAFEVKSELVIRNALNYPNPFSEATEFSFGLSRHADINISIYTLAGRKIKELSAGRRSPGYHQIPWDGYDADGDIPANGVYLYQIRAESEKEQKTVLNKCIIAR